jgi:hypothetical protein
MTKPKQEIQALAEGLVNKILENTHKGIDKEGKRFVPYSEKPFWMPYKGVANKSRIPNDRRPKSKDAKWITWKGGYVEYRGSMGRSTSTVDLTMTGRLLRNLQPLKIDTEEIVIDLAGLGIEGLSGKLVLPIPKIEITIGFSDKELQELASWIINGTVRTKGGGMPARDFLGLKDEDVLEVVKNYLL